MATRAILASKILKIFPGGHAPGPPYMDVLLAYISNITLQKAHVYSDLRPSINSLLVLITKMNGIIVVIGLLP